MCKDFMLNLLGVDIKNYEDTIINLNLEIGSLNDKLEVLQNTLSNKDRTISVIVKQKAEYLSQITQLQELVEILTDKLSLSKDTDNELENTLNNKYPKKNRLYLRYETDGDYQIDVRNYFQTYDSSLPVVSGRNSDKIALNCINWVIDNITYVSDSIDYKQTEYWAYGYQTLKHRTGDCEDGAILLANMLVANGVPYYRVRLNAGSVRGGGHCYVTYCRETDNKFVVLDWCYNPNKKEMKDRPTHKEERNYINQEKNYYVWFSWNLKYIFGKLKEEDFTTTFV